MECPKCKEEIPEESSVCNYCGAALLPAEAEAPAEEGAAAAEDFRDLLLGIKVAGSLREGELGACDLLLENKSEKRMTDIRFRIFSRALSEEVSLGPVRTLDPGAYRGKPLAFDLEPTKAGSAVRIGIEVRFRDERGLATVVQGESRLTITRQHKGGDQVNLSIQGEKIMGVDMHQMVQMDRRRTTSLHLEGDQDWRKIDLYFDYEQTEAERDRENFRKRVVEIQRSPDFPVRVATLQCLQARPCRTYYLIPRAEIVLGRQRADARGIRLNDVILGLMPETDDNRILTQRISRQHARIRFDGDQFFLSRHHPEAAPTLLNGEPLCKDGEKLLASGDLIEISGVLNLRLVISYLLEEAPAVEFTPSLPPLSGGTDLVRCGINRPGRVACARLYRENNAPESEIYLMILKQARIGSDPKNSICLPENSLDPMHARIFYHEGRLFLEDLGSESGTTLGDRKLQPNEVVPLADGMILKIGEACFEYRMLA